jgi:prevent-host-death family protein
MEGANAMPSVVSATEARVHFGEILRRVGVNGETVFVEKAGRLQAVVIGAAELGILAGRRLDLPVSELLGL